MNEGQLKEILEKHELWVNDEKGGERANLCNANLSGANLCNANLSGANLSGANLCNADLSGANLYNADLSGANLYNADLIDANLYNADLIDANLCNADLRGADLRSADLSGADLYNADLIDANLWNCPGNRREIKSLFVSEAYSITYTAEVLQIGCERHAIKDWWKFDDRRILEMDGERALKFWLHWKDFIKSIIEKSPAKKTNHKSEESA